VRWPVARIDRRLELGLLPGFGGRQAPRGSDEVNEAMAIGLLQSPPGDLGLLDATEAESSSHQQDGLAAYAPTI
jgi:hypothetical protein